MFMIHLFICTNLDSLPIAYPPLSMLVVHLFYYTVFYFLHLYFLLFCVCSYDCRCIICLLLLDLSLCFAIFIIFW